MQLPAGWGRHPRQRAVAGFPSEITPRVVVMPQSAAEDDAGAFENLEAPKIVNQVGSPLKTRTTHGHGPVHGPWLPVYRLLSFLYI